MPREGGASVIPGMCHLVEAPLYWIIRLRG
jgi:hypothetical protein